MVPEGEVDDTGFSMALVERLRPYMAESLMVLNADWSIRANLAPPGGLIGQGLGVGLHTLEHMHPDDAVLIMELGAQAWDTEPGWQGTKVVRMRRGDNTYGRYEIMAVNMLDDPIVSGMVVRTREIIDEVADDLNGLDTSSALESVAELLPIGLLLLDAQARIVFVNRSAQQLLQQDPDSLKRTGIESLVEPSERTEFLAIIDKLTAAPGHHECMIRLATDPIIVARCRFSAEGTEYVTRIVATLEDATDSHAEHLDLQHQATHDSLTGLHNRWSIMSLIHDRIQRNIPISVAYVDLDGFKSVNDTWGHDRGDQLLMTVAQALRNGLGDRSVIARIGGDEFIVMWDDSSITQEIAQTIHDIVSGVTRPEGLKVSASIGTAAWTSDDTPQDLIRRADLAMYARKLSRTGSIDLLGDHTDNR